MLGCRGCPVAARLQCFNAVLQDAQQGLPVSRVGSVHRSAHIRLQSSGNLQLQRPSEEHCFARDSSLLQVLPMHVKPWVGHKHGDITRCDFGRPARGTAGAGTAGTCTQTRHRWHAMIKRTSSLRGCRFLDLAAEIDNDRVVGARQTERVSVSGTEELGKLLFERPHCTSDRHARSALQQYRARL